MNELLDFNQVLDEMWVVAQEEMNFQTEAANLERFRKLNEDVAFVSSPALYRDYTTTTVLVMERIDGVGIAQKDELAAAGYDLSEIGAKLADNYVKQIMDDGFFHADPHPGNLRVREGKIVWLDMGMMGSLSDRQRELIGKAITGVARGDVNACRDAVLGLGELRQKPDKHRLYRDMEDLLEKYASADLGTMDLAEVMQDMTEVMHQNGIAMPSSLTMLARGLATIEGVVAELSPELNVMSVVTARLGRRLLSGMDWRSTLAQDAGALYESAHKSLEIPALIADILHTGLKGEANLGIEHHPGKDMAELVHSAVEKVCGALLGCGLLVTGALLRQTPPLAGELSVYSIVCFVLAAGAACWPYRKRKKR